MFTHENVDVAVVVVVGKGGAPAGFVLDERSCDLARQLLKTAVSKVAIDLPRLVIPGFDLEGVDLGINVPVGDEEIEEAVVVEIDKRSSPAQIGPSKWSRVPRETSRP